MSGAQGILFPDRLGAVSTVAEGVSMVHAFANVGLVYGRGEVLVVDVSTAMTAPLAVQALRGLTGERVAALVYTHGHVDHAGGAPAFLADAEARGHAPPEVWAQARVRRRFSRYGRTWAWNNEVNRRQFGMPAGSKVFPERFVEPTRDFEEQASLSLAGERVELYHAEGETDDATWVWLPEREVALVGDLLINSLPNTGNPNKPQRYTLGWAQALEAILAKRPRHVLPGHGEPASGELALVMLQDTARALRFVHDWVIERLNEGLWPDDVFELDLALPADLAQRPYLQPIYGAVPFIVRDVLRAYAGWWGGAPEELLPRPREVCAQDLLALAGRGPLLARAQALRQGGELRRALALAMVARRADRTDPEARALCGAILEALAESETSFIARNFFRALSLEP